LIRLNARSPHFGIMATVSTGFVPQDPCHVVTSWRTCASLASASGALHWEHAMKEKTATAIYVCPMHAEVREARPGRCPACGMNLLPQGARFMLLRHMLGNPLPLVALAGVMIVVMAAATMMMR
jgi:hypothetical protein